MLYPLQERLVWSCKAWHHRCITFRGPYRCWIAAQQGTRSSLSKSEINSGKPSMGSSTRPELHMTGLVDVMNHTDSSRVLFDGLWLNANLLTRKPAGS